MVPPRLSQSLAQDSDKHSKLDYLLDDLVKVDVYILADKAYKALPGLLADHHLTVQGRLKRGFLTDNEGYSHKVIIIGKATDENGRLIHIIGEGKSQLSQNDIDRFLRRKLKPFEGVYDPIFPILITHMTTSPDVEAYAESNGIALYYSYEF
jgi:hypothetical protein